MHIMLPGGHSAPSRDITPQIQKLADDVKPQLEEQLGRPGFSEYQLLEFRQQVVAGMIYHFKIRISPSECVHAKVFHALPHEQKGPEVQAAVLKTSDDRLELLGSD
jgi:hypothetical protein